ncbi:ADP-ribosyl cyclase/cyclic ADP-ribose hydrolase 1-like isoform X2 [Alosa alosa]|uniref:ADP-ribosyl cyclase/cyclic ADP-ribose hydrolase 1-like isoform X2 n=1 Tax=Alosa alosa TaxID=278164 RepID=UPI0020152BFD|nr:ADP-ribosyl cyclase/cyclic ADP-ribose hydrolase 1-like isoform X2 [Alosa alosa]
MVYTEVNRTSNRSPKRRNHLLICLCVVLMAIVILSVTLGLTLGTSSSSSLKATFTNRCQTYLKDNGATTSQNDCEKIWESFKQAFVGRNPCDVPPDAYDSLLHKVSHDPACNRMLFWSKTKEIVHAFTGKMSCYLTLEDTLLGFTLDGLNWCGKNESQETFTTGCPDCDNNSFRAFWNGASAAFAASACGDASVMLNGSIDMPFNSKSIFGSVEVKHFNSSIMNGLTVLLVTKETDTSKIQNCISQPQIACGDCW